MDDAQELLLRLLDQTPPGSLKHVQPRGLPPLIYCCSICDDDLAKRILDLHQKHDIEVDVDDTEPCSNYTPLHMCCELGLPELVKTLLQARASLERKSADLVQPFGHPIPGGRTPLHVAAAAGSRACVELLLNAGASTSAKDFDQNTPAALAGAAGHTALAALLAPPAGGENASVAQLADKVRRDHMAASDRVSRGLQVSGPFTEVHTLKQIWGVDYCDKLLKLVLEVASRRGWDCSRHQAYPTTDIKCSDMPHEVNVEIRGSIEQLVFPKMQLLYGLESASLRFRDLFFVFYCAAGTNGSSEDLYANSDGAETQETKKSTRPPPQSSLPLHRDGSILSFNVLLNRPSDFDGGGTYVEPLQKTFHIGQGDFFLHSGRVLHAGAEVTKGERYVLVGFIDALNRDGTHAVS